MRLPLRAGSTRHTATRWWILAACGVLWFPAFLTGAGRLDGAPQGCSAIASGARVWPVLRELRPILWVPCFPRSARSPVSRHRSGVPQVPRAAGHGPVRTEVPEQPRVALGKGGRQRLCAAALGAVPCHGCDTGRQLCHRAAGCHGPQLLRADVWARLPPPARRWPCALPAVPGGRGAAAPRNTTLRGGSSLPACSCCQEESAWSFGRKLGQKCCCRSQSLNIQVKSLGIRGLFWGAYVSISVTAACQICTKQHHRVKILICSVIIWKIWVC